MDRSYTPPQLDVRDTRQIEATPVAGVQGQYRPATVMTDSGYMDSIIAGILREGADTLDRLGETMRGNAYLEGQQKALLGQSEAEIQGDPITKDWETAGFRDTYGKLQLADATASFGVDIKELRQQSAEQFRQYLDNRRNTMLPQIQGMSREARVNTLSQLLLQDRADTKTWTTEHQKFIIEQKSAAISQAFGTQVSALGNAQIQYAMGQAKPEDYQEHLRATGGSLYTNVWLDQSLPMKVKQELTSSAISVALAKDQVDLYDYLNNTEVPDDNGGKSTLLSRLPLGDQQKLASEYTAAMIRTADRRDLGRRGQLAQIEAGIQSGTYNGSEQALDSFLSGLVQNKTISGEKRESVLRAFYTKRQQQQDTAGLAGAYMRGDLFGIYQAGADTEKAAKAVQETMKGQPPTVVMDAFLTAGINGNADGFKQAGRFLSGSLNQLLNSKDNAQLPAMRQIMTATMNALSRADAKGEMHARAALLSGLSEDERLNMEQLIRLQQDEHLPFEEAVQRVRSSIDQDAGLTPNQRAARVDAKVSQIEKAIDSQQAQGWASQFFTYIHGIFNERARTASGTSVSSGGLFDSSNDSTDWFATNRAQGHAYLQASKEALRAEVRSVALQRPDASPADILGTAQANLMSRTIGTKYGPVFLPRGASVQSLYGVEGGNAAAVGKAMGELLPAEDGEYWTIRVDNGVTRAFKHDKDGNAMNSSVPTVLSPQAIQAKIKEDTWKEGNRATEMQGPGKVVKGPNGASVRYSGANTVGVPNAWAMGLRDSLVANEGVRNKVYKDANGTNTVGVGIAQTNEYYPVVKPGGTLDEAGISLSFMRASDAAMKYGYNLARSNGFNGQAGFTFFSELVYQSGPGVLKQDAANRMVGYMKQGNAAAAEEQLRRTVAWKMSGPSDLSVMTPRRKTYLNGLHNTMKGM